MASTSSTPRGQNFVALALALASKTPGLGLGLDHVVLEHIPDTKHQWRICVRAPKILPLDHPLPGVRHVTKIVSMNNTSLRLIILCRRG